MGLFGSNYRIFTVCNDKKCWLPSNSGPEDKEITVSFTNSKTVAVPLDTAIWIPTEVYERLALELKMPKEAREALSTENSYPKESLEGNSYISIYLYL